jgi:hypothetical protein
MRNRAGIIPSRYSRNGVTDPVRNHFHDDHDNEDDGTEIYIQGVFRRDLDAAHIYFH